MEINAIDAAKQILYAGTLHHCNDITNLKLQKLLYFANLLNISILGKPLFQDKIEAWDLGPVVREVYHRYKCFNDHKIDEDNVCSKDENLANIVECVILMFGAFPASRLVNITHEDPIYKQAEEREDKIMTHNRQDALNMIESQMKSISQRAAYASLKGKINPNELEKLPPYIDDYKGVSEEERKKIWGIYE